MEALVKSSSKLNEILVHLRLSSYKEKTSSFLNDKKLDQYLNATQNFKKILEDKTDKICDINNKLEQLTWISDLDENSLMLINDLISYAKDIRSSLIRQCISYQPIKNKGIATKAIEDFENSIDELKEAFEDLESVFFFLPNMPEFKETTKALSLI